MCLFKSAPSDVEEIFSGYLETNISDRYSQMIALCLKIVDYRSWTGYPRSLKRVVCGSLPTIRCQERWQHKAPICSAGSFFLIIWANFEVFLCLHWSFDNPNLICSCPLTWGRLQAVMEPRQVFSRSPVRTFFLENVFHHYYILSLSPLYHLKFKFRPSAVSFSGEGCHLEE